MIKIRNLTTKMCEGEILMTRTLAKIRVQNFDVFYTSEFLFRPNIKIPMCYSLVKPTWYPLFSFTWNSIPGEGVYRVCMHMRIRTEDPLPFLQTQIQAGYHPNLLVERSELYSCHLNVHLLGHQSLLRIYFVDF